MRMVYSWMILFFLFIAFNVEAQRDAHYGSTQFGLKGMLMSGALVGGDDDASLIYYNPASIGYVRERAIDVSLFVPSIEITTLKNAFGENTNNTEFDFDVIPNFISYKLSLIKNPKVSTAAAVLYKQNVENALLFNFETEQEGNTINNTIQYDRRFREVWIGFGMSYDISQKFSAGVSQFITFRRNIQTHEFIQTISPNNSNEAIALYENSLNADVRAQFGMVTKLGLMYRTRKVNLGLTFTTPTYGYPIRLLDYQYNEITKAPEANEIVAERYANERQKIELKTPYSVAAGLIFKFKKNSTLNFSAEYFGKVRSYNMLNKQAANDDFTIQLAARQVINAAIGWQIQVSDKVYYLGGFRTDFNFSGTLDETTTELYQSNWDIYHLSNGVSFWLNNNKFTVGVEYGFSFDKFDEAYLNLNNFAGALNATTLTQAQVSYQSLTLLITYALLLEGFKKKKKEK